MLYESTSGIVPAVMYPEWLSSVPMYVHLMFIATHLHWVDADSNAEFELNLSLWFPTRSVPAPSQFVVNVDTAAVSLTVYERVSLKLKFSSGPFAINP